VNHPKADFSIRILASLVGYVAEHHGAGAVAELARAAGLDPAELRAGNRWLTHEAMERLLACARELLESDECFVEACGFEIGKTSLPGRFLIGAIGPRDAYELGARHSGLISTVSSFSVRRQDSGQVVIRYDSTKPESRLMCLSRQAQIAHLPELWRLPKAHLEERSCIAHGDSCCEYGVSVYEPNRWLPVAIGLIVGLCSAFLVGALQLGTIATSIALALLGAGSGRMFELRRSNRLNSATSSQVNAAYLAVAQEEAQARFEIMAMTRRQHAWIQRLEERDGERSQAFDQLARGVESMRENWVSSIRGFSHDLRNPLTALKTNVAFLRETPDQLGPDGADVLADIGQAVSDMEKLLANLMVVASSDNGSIRLEPQTVLVSSLTVRIRARLNALVYGRGIKASVLPTREAPETVEVDPLLLDRILDNLLSNAAKYTERGSIVVEIDGTPGFLTLKISDTGCGIHESEIEQIFRAGGSRRESRAKGSWGVGLSVVVQLLARAGGRLEVMSKPAVGTTFWAHLPIASAPASQRAPSDAPHHPDRDVSNVVSIRRLKTA
jgi:signal transduction histidine kinase